MNCKPGDLAIIVAALNTPENIGRIVEVISPAFFFEAYQLIGGDYVTLDTSGQEAIWRVRSDKPLLWRGDNGFLARAYEVPCGDRFLRPIGGVPVDEDVLDEVPA